MSEQSESEPEEEEEDEQETKSPKSQKPPTEAQLRREAARAEKANQKKAAKDQKNARNDKLNERRAGVDNKKVRAHACYARSLEAQITDLCTDGRLHQALLVPSRPN